MYILYIKLNVYNWYQIIDTYLLTLQLCPQLRFLKKKKNFKKLF